MEISDEEGNRCLSMGIGEVAGRLVISTREGNPSISLVKHIEIAAWVPGASGRHRTKFDSKTY